MMGLPMMTILIFLPLAAAIVVAAIDRKKTGALYGVGLAGSLAALAMAAVVFVRVDPDQAALQFVERTAWIPSAGVSYHIGVDGISLPLVMLTAVIMPLALLSAWGSVAERVKEFVFSMLVLETALLGPFLAADLVLFYVFWEAVLIPMYFIIGLWGGPRRSYAAVKFVLYTMAGSALMLVAIITLYLHSGAQVGARTFDLAQLRQLRVAMPLQAWLFGAFALAFAIKVPVWPLHTWLPDAHVEAPTAGSVVLAAVLLKMGTYGFLRFLLPLFPQATLQFAPLLSALAILGIIYGVIVSWAQPDVKRLVAMSSVSHLGLVTLGAFVMTVPAMQGSLLQMVNHGISTGGLFLIVGVLYDRTHSRLLGDYGGVAALMPRLAPLALIVVLSSLALPGTNGFVREFLILLGTFRPNPLYAALATSGVILSAVYLLWMYHRVMHGPLAALGTTLTAGADPRPAFAGMYVRDALTRVMQATALLAVLLAQWLSGEYVERTGLETGEYYALMLVAALGAMLMAASSDLIMLFLGLETLSIPLYVLAAFARTDLRSQEAGLKYFLLGAFGTAFFLYGIALLFGATGSTGYRALAEHARTPVAIFQAGLALLTIGLAFKAAVVPFHFWAPDVYEGAPLPATAYMSVIAKVGAFAAFLRVYVVPLAAQAGEWSTLLAAISVLPLNVGNAAALRQTSIKRLLP